MVTLPGPDETAAAAAVRLPQPGPIERLPFWSDTQGDEPPPLHVAAWSSGAARVRELLAGGADVRANSSTWGTALHWAAAAGNTQAISALIDAGADVAAECEMRGDQISGPFTALHLAAGSGRAPAVEALLDAGASVKSLTEDERTPLHWAGECGSGVVVVALLGAGA
eukprot:contig_14327_g3441